MEGEEAGEEQHKEEQHKKVRQEHFLLVRFSQFIYCPQLTNFTVTKLPTGRYRIEDYVLTY